ncbi:MAG: AarF/UbiB family protein [Candidatus Binatia bacterium]
MSRAATAFTDDGPWPVDPERMPWRGPVDALRAQSRAEVPTLVARRRLPPVGRFTEAVALLGTALAGWALRERRRGGAGSRAGLSRRLRIAFERLGPSYIKLGQIVSSGQGLFPEELVAEFRRCRDQVPPEPFDVVRRVVEEDLGAPLDQVFARFDRECLAAASIAQVHAARLATGEEVVVKVQRPAVARLVRRDIAAMAWIAPFLVGRIPVAALANPPALVELFAETILEELDFRLEAQNMLDVADVLARAGQTIIVVPRPHPVLVTRRVLVMERLGGFRYEDVDGMRAAGVDPAAVVRALLIAFLEGAMIFGVFHGDLHGGNLFITSDGRVALFDYGITARMDEQERLAFLRLMMCGAVNDVRGQLVAFRDLGALGPDADFDAILRALRLDEPIRDPTTMSGQDLMREIRDVTKGLLAQGARLPKPLMLYVKGMLFFDSAMTHMAPEVNLFEQLVRVYGYFAERHGDQIHRDVGIDPRLMPVDLEGVRRAMRLEGDVTSLTQREVNERRQAIQRRLTEPDD